MHLSSLISDLGNAHAARPSPFSAVRRDGRWLLRGYALQWAVTGSRGIWFDATAAGAEYSDDGVELPLLHKHNPESVIGACRLTTDTEGLFATAVLPGDDLGLAGMLQTGGYGGFSADIVVPQGAMQFGSGRPTSAAAWSVVAVSAVSVRPETLRVDPAAGPLKVNSKGELVDMLRAAGLSRAASDRVAAGGWAGLNQTLPTEASITAAIDALNNSLS